MTSSLKNQIAEDRAAPLPRDFTELVEFRELALDRKLGYHRNEGVVIFGYCLGGREVMWRDAHSCGFGTGGWRCFLDEVAPLAERYGANLGGDAFVGTHVLVINRVRAAVYVAPRASAEEFLAQIHGLPRSTRRCMCAMPDCGSCTACARENAVDSTTEPAQ